MRCGVVQVCLSDPRQDLTFGGFVAYPKDMAVGRRNSPCRDLLAFVGVESGAQVRSSCSS